MRRRRALAIAATMLAAPRVVLAQAKPVHDRPALDRIGRRRRIRRPIRRWHAGARLRRRPGFRDRSRIARRCLRRAGLSGAETLARELGIEVRSVRVSSAGEIDTAIPAIKGLQVQAVLVVAASLFGAHPKRVVSAVSALRLPALYSNLTIADAGGLVVYTPDLSENFGRAASYVGRILKGAKPGDLPVEQATTFRLIVNRQAARDLGMTLPASVLAGAEIR